MTKTKFSVLLVAANVLILAAAFYYFVYSKTSTPVVETATAPEPPVDLKTEAPRPQAEPSNTVSVVIVTNQFHWRQVESTNYRTYIANLRGIGCPEPTIKDIVLTDIMKLFAARRGQFYQNGREFKFWETGEKRALNARQLEEREKQMSKIDKEVPGVLRDLLGVNYEREVNKYFVDNGEDDRRLGFVSQEKRDRLLALREELEGLKEHLLDPMQGGKPVDPEALKKIQEHRNEILSQILTPAEREEYDLRTSETAERLRTELVGFNPTEQEFRELYRVWQAHDEKFALLPAADEATKKAKEQDRQRIEAEVMAKLAPERVVDFERAKSQDYQQLSFFAERYELPTTTVQTLSEIKQAAENARQSLLAQPALGETERAVALKAIQQETQQAIRQNLGDKLFPAYTQNAGSWVSALGATGPAAK